MGKKGAVLIYIFLVIVVLTILGVAIFNKSVSERSLAQQYVDSTQAFWLAEAGVNQALYELRNNYDTASVSSTGLGAGEFSAQISVSGSDRIVVSTGEVPSGGTARSSRDIQVEISKDIPANFYDNAIYSAGEVDLNGNAYTVNGNVIYGDDLDYSQNHITGTVTEDSSITPLARFDFQELRDLSSAQNNVYVEDGPKLVNQATGSEDFPASFWYSAGVPNIIYIEGDLSLNGNIGTVGGFFVVVGDVLTNPDAAEEASVNGVGTIEGVIYTRGDFDVNGGAGNLNVNGGVWSGEEAELNGNSNVTYNQAYMEAIEALDLVGTAQINSWDDTQNPYGLD